MSTHGELVDEVLDFLREDSVSAAKVTKLLNEGISFVADKVLLPDLESSGSFLTVPGSYYANIPVEWNFGRNIYSARSESCRIRVLPSLAHLLEKHGTNLDSLITGPVKYLATVGERVVYTCSPLWQETIYCKFYKKPTLLVSENDVPTCIPDHLQKRLLVNYALMNAYDLKEDGLEGLKVNTGHHKNLFIEALDSFDVSVKTGISEPELDRTTTWI